MNDLHTYLSELCNERLYQMILSNPREKDGISRIKIRPVMVKQELMFQETCFQGTQVFHKNYQAGDMVPLWNVTWKTNSDSWRPGTWRADSMCL